VANQHFENRIDVLFNHAGTVIINWYGPEADR
jgi:hypothetical protein